MRRDAKAPSLALVPLMLAMPVLDSATAPAAEAREPDRECAVAVPAESGPQPSQRQAEYRSRLHSFATGTGVKVAVIDTGVFPHEQLHALTPGADFVTAEEPDPLRDCDLHGTVVAGIIAGRDIGIAPRAEIYSVRQTSAHYRTPSSAPGNEGDAEATAGSLETLAQAIRDAVDAHARVINVSVVSCVPPHIARRVDTSSLDAALAHAEANGAVVVSAAGNASGSSSAGATGCRHGDEVFPANAGTVVSVAAQADAHSLADYSLGGGASTSVAAEGHVPLALSSSGGWAKAKGTSGGDPTGAGMPFRGTSFAAPVVTGTLALMAERYPELSPAELRQRLYAAAEPGHGFIDPLTAITHLPAGAPAPTKRPSITPVREDRSLAATRAGWALAALAGLLAALALGKGLARRR